MKIYLKTFGIILTQVLTGQNVSPLLNISSAHTFQKAMSNLESCQISSTLSLSLTAGNIAKCSTNIGL